MRDYIIKRVLLMIPALLGVSILVFSLTRLLPGDVVMGMLADSPNYRKSEADQLRHELGLDKPAPQQFVEWVGNAVRGDLGRSLWTKEPVRDEILKRLPVTLELGILTLLVSASSAVLFGILSAIRQDTIVDYLLRVFS